MTSEAARRLARPELAPVVDELARRFGDGEVTTVALRGLDPGGLAALADLLGSPRLPPASGRLRVRSLLAALGLADVGELRHAIVELRGPIADRRASRATAAAEREALWSWLADSGRALSLGHSLDGWVVRVRAAGMRGGVERHRRRLERALAVLRRLPADGITLAALASDVLGDPHGLDRGRSVAALVTDALAGDDPAASARDSEGIRAVWERAGVAPDAVSSTVLVLGLRPPGNHALGAYLTTASTCSEPVVLTLAQLRRWPLPPLEPNAAAYTVENPSLVAEAARRGWERGPVLVCSSGRPTVAVVELIRQLTVRGAAMHQHADFDVAGLGITAWLAERARTRPWRMSAGDYEAAAGDREERIRLAGRLPPTSWDPVLGDAMAAAGHAVYEEELRASLLDEMVATDRGRSN